MRYEKREKRVKRKEDGLMIKFTTLVTVEMEKEYDLIMPNCPI